MFIGESEHYTFTNNETGRTLPVYPIPNQFNELKCDRCYVLGDYVYEYIGEINRMADTKPGQIFKRNGRFFINRINPDKQELFSVSNIRHIEDEEQSAEKILSQYIYNFNIGNNIAKDNQSKMVTSGETYVPELKDSDDALTRIMKLMIIHKKLILNNYRDNCDKKYSLDNIRSAINGATINMTITRFLTWCDLLHLDWEFHLFDNGTDPINPLPYDLKISPSNPLTCDYGDEEKGIYKVPLSEDDDPLKRIIKVAIILKHINLNNYRDKGSTPHLINNMRSALKRKSKMMIPYFIYWCEILGMDYLFRVIDPVDGTVFEADTNYKATEYLED